MQQILELPADQLLGGRYRLGPLIAIGGMSAVHRAWDELIERPVAIKLYRPNLDPAAQARFGEEAKTMARLSHPGLVSVYDAGTEGEQPYLVLQLIDGPTLREHLADGPLPAGEVRRIGERLAQTLAYVHGRDVIHRDVKPSNVLLDGDANPYLADFGISRMVDGARVTGTGQFVGTAGYLAPEQVRGEDAGPAVDVYALGLVLLECLTGRAEYTGSDVEAAVARLSRAPRIPTGLPADLATLISAMTDSDPLARPTAAECAAALAEPTGEVALFLPRPATSPKAARTSTRRHRERGVLVAAASVALLAAGLGWAALSGGQPGSPASVESGPATAPVSVLGVVAEPPAVQVQPAAPADEPPVNAVQQPVVSGGGSAASDDDGDDDGKEDDDGKDKGKDKKSDRG